MSPATINWRPPATRAAITSSAGGDAIGENAVGEDSTVAASGFGFGSGVKVDGAPGSLTSTVITAACTKITTAAAVADQESVRGVRLDRNSERRLPRSKILRNTTTQIPITRETRGSALGVGSLIPTHFFLSS